MAPSQIISADNQASVKNVLMVAPGAVINAPIIFAGDRAETVTPFLVGGYGPHVEFDRHDAWSRLREVLDAREHDCVFVLGECEQAHDSFALRLWGHLVRDAAARVRVCTVKWGLAPTEEHMRKALARGLGVADTGAVPQLEQVAAALRAASADGPLALLHTCIRADDQGRMELKDLAWYYREHLPSLAAAAAEPGRARQIVAFQPIEWTPIPRKKWWRRWISPQARVDRLIQRLRRERPAPFRVNDLVLEDIPVDERRRLLPFFLEQFDLRGPELQATVEQLAQPSTTRSLFEALSYIWRNKQGRRDGGGT